ncbi:unnamed protein product [Lampetra planeri]
MLNLVTVVASSAALGRPRETRPSVDDLGLQRGAVTKTAAITPAVGEEAAILDAQALKDVESPDEQPPTGPIPSTEDAEPAPSPQPPPAEQSAG